MLIYEKTNNIQFGDWLFTISNLTSCWQWYNFAEEGFVDVIKLSVDTEIDDLELERRIYLDDGCQCIQPKQIGVDVSKYSHFGFQFEFKQAEKFPAEFISVVNGIKEFKKGTPNPLSPHEPSASRWGS